MTNYSRRVFLKTTAGGAALAAGGLPFLSGQQTFAASQLGNCEL